MSPVFAYFYPEFVSKISKYVNNLGKIARALQRAHAFAARKVHWTLRLSGSALRIAFARYALSAKAVLAPVFVSIFAKKGNKCGRRDRQSEEWWGVGVLRV
ncbi:hypothetical protein ACWA09_00095 [Gardnerella vaginalis]